MPKQWSQVALGEILTERNETPDPALVRAGDIPIISKIRFSDGGIELRTDSDTNTKMILIHPGDLVLSGINAMKGAIAIYQPETSQRAAATIHYAAYEVNKEKVDIRYLWWLLRSQYFQDILSQQVPQGIKTELKAKRLLPVSIPLPSIEEQQQIVKKIEMFSEKIVLLELLQEKAIEESTFFKLSILNKFRSELFQSLYPREKLGNVTKVTSGGTPSRTNPSFWGGTIPWLKTGELHDGDIEDAEEFITHDGLLNSSAKIFPVDTILIALYGQGQTRGRTGRLAIEAATNQACCAVLPVDCLEPQYLLYWLSSMYTELREKAHGGAQPNWNIQMIKDLEIVIPPKIIQERFIDQINRYNIKVKELTKIQQSAYPVISSLLPSLLDKVFQGKLT